MQKEVLMLVVCVQKEKGSVDVGGGGVCRKVLLVVVVVVVCAERC